MKVFIEENHYINDPMSKPSKSTALSDVFKTVLNNIDNNDTALEKKAESTSLCGIGSNLTDENNSINNESSATNNDDNSEKIYSCYECEVKDDCQRFKDEKTDILMGKKISLTVKYDPISRKKIPVFTSPNNEIDDSLNRMLLFSNSYYYSKKFKRKNV